MAPILPDACRSDFVELDRSFRELSFDGREPDEFGIALLRHARGGKRTLWADLLCEHRVVLLSEAGSGKTWEIMNQARKLREQGREAFFLRLEFVLQHLEAAFEVGTYEEFTRWRESDGEGWILLDSVDEARLRHPRDFEWAIRRLGSLIGSAMERAHVFITGRASAWRPKSDLECCTHSFPPVKDPKQAAESAPSPHDGGAEEDASERESNRPGFKVVAFEDLTREQITRFVRARGVENAQTFLDAIERADAQTFVARPKDLEELVGFWRDNGRIGSRLEIMRSSLARRLKEWDQDRADHRPLSPDRARQGARLLAAASTLSRRPIISVPGGVEESNSILVGDVLPDWDEKELATLLSRPIFDAAVYGGVRFHHRSVREYLTAEWFADLLSRDASRRAIEALFFRSHYGVDFIAPTLRPILPWLAILDERIRERVRRAAPEIFFEGGDPSQLPLELRRDILSNVCAKMVHGEESDRSSHDHAAVMRFASPDLTEGVRALLLQHAGNKEVTWLLLRMVWVGRMVGAAEEAIDVALSPAVYEHVRIAAFRAVQAVASPEQQERVRRSFLAEAPQLKRSWLEALLDGLQPTTEIIGWLVACLQKCEPKERHRYDDLTVAVERFVEAAEIRLLPQLISGLSGLLGTPPFVQRHSCEISERSQWLMSPACKAVGRLILARHAGALEPDVLEILRKLPAALIGVRQELANYGDEFARLVPAWPELNRALFWHEAHQRREALDEEAGQRLVHYWNVTPWPPLWSFDAKDFEYLLQEIDRRPLHDDRLVALSLAFVPAVAAGRPPAWRVRLRKLTAGNEELSRSLADHLEQSARPRAVSRAERETVKWQGRIEAERKKEEADREDWSRYLRENLDEVRAGLRSRPGTVTQSFWYLHHATEGELINSDWSSLIPRFGEAVARFYRDEAIRMWREYDPPGRSADGALPPEIIGLCGLEIESKETEGWPQGLSEPDVRRACRYAAGGIHSVPGWLGRLFDVYPEIVGGFLLDEIQRELSTREPSATGFSTLDAVRLSAGWAWNWIAPKLVEFLKLVEPKNLVCLDRVLKILQESDLPDRVIADLALEKCRTIQDPDHLPRWLAVLSGVDADVAIPSLKANIEALKTREERTAFVMAFVTRLTNGRLGNDGVARVAYQTPGHLMSLIRLVHEHVRMTEDINRSGAGAYTPGLRDQAQNAREGLFELLKQIPGVEAFQAMLDIAKDFPDADIRPWIRYQAIKKAQEDGDIEPWPPSMIKDFSEKLERTPGSHRELAELAVHRLLDLKDDLEHGDCSLAGLLKQVEETEVRNFIANAMREHAHGRYTIMQEEELADAKRPDLRFHGMGFDGPVPVELKLADNWSGPELCERLRNQLCGDYLRDRRSRRGIFLLVNQGSQESWRILGDGKLRTFTASVDALQGYWDAIAQEYPGVEEVKVIGIDLTKRSS